MDPVTIIGITLALVDKFGPVALREFEKWKAQTGGKPTAADWAALESLAKPPEAYEPR